jgi:nucleotide-binding universal stress UspA family protein
MQNPVQRILFATDLSSKARHMFPYVVKLAANHCASLVILHVLQEEPKKETYINMVNNLIGEERWNAMREADTQRARSIMIGKKAEASQIRSAVVPFCAHIRKQHPEIKLLEDDIIAVQGTVPEAIVKTAVENKCDLIVMGYHRRGGLTDIMAGNILKSVLRQTYIPVLLIPPTQEMEQ